MTTEVPDYNKDLFERFFISRSVYGIPEYQWIIAGTLFFSIMRHIIFKVAEPIAFRWTNTGYANAELEKTERYSHGFVKLKCQKYIYHTMWFSGMIPWIIAVGMRWDGFSFYYSYDVLAEALRKEVYGMTLSADEKSVVATDLSKPIYQEFQLLLLAQLCWYLHNFILDTLWDNKRGDYFLMVIHHIVAMALVYGCFQMNLEMSGLCVLFIMDTVDVLIYGSKLFQIRRYTNDGKPRTKFDQSACNGLMVFITIMWWYVRVYLFSNFVLVTYDGVYTDKFVSVFDASLYWKGTIPIFGYVAVWLLISLLILQIIWAILIARISIKMCYDGYITDDIHTTFDEKKKHHFAENKKSE